MLWGCLQQEAELRFLWHEEKADQLAAILLWATSASCTCRQNLQAEQPTCLPLGRMSQGLACRHLTFYTNPSDSLLDCQHHKHRNLTYSACPFSRHAGSCRWTFRSPPGWVIAVHAHCKVHCAHAQEPLHDLSVQDCQCSSCALAPNQHLIEVSIPGICRDQCGTAPQQSASQLLLYRVSACCSRVRLDIRLPSPSQTPG